MNEETSETRDFRPDYAVLELTESADWNSVRENYRRLVHLWHPDRYAQRPRERAHAQQQFITLTKSYTFLRNFHREHGRLPFEPAGNRPTHEHMTTLSRNRKHQQGSHGRTKTSTDGGSTTEGAVEPGVLGRGEAARASKRVPLRKSRMVWALAGCAVLLATVSIFLMLDRQANQAVIERGREALRDAPSSDFMPSAAEIRRSEAKGAFVQPTK